MTELARASAPAHTEFLKSRAKGHAASLLIARIGNVVSSLIRDRLTDGDIAAALELLGTPLGSGGLDRLWEEVGARATGCRGEFGEPAGVVSSVLWSWGFYSWTRKRVYGEARRLRGRDGVFVIPRDADGKPTIISGQDLDDVRAGLGDDYELLAALLRAHPVASAALYHKGGRFLVYHLD